MPDIQNLVFTDLANANRNVNRWQVTCEVRDSNTGALIANVTVVWPDDLSAFTLAQRRSIQRQIVQRLIYMKAGLDAGDD